MKKVILSILSISTLLITSCSLDNDDQNNGGITGEEVTAQNLAGNLTTDLTLNSGVTHNLIGTLLVKDGATLTIDAGGVLFGQSGSDYLVVHRDAKVMAEGNKSKPIILTS